MVGEPALPVPAQRSPDDGRAQPRAALRLGRRVRQPALGREQFRERRLAQRALDGFGDHHGMFSSGKRHLLPRVLADDPEEEDDAAGGEDREAGVHVFFFFLFKKKEKFLVEKREQADETAAFSVVG